MTCAWRNTSRELRVQFKRGSEKVYARSHLLNFIPFSSSLGRSHSHLPPHLPPVFLICSSHMYIYISLSSSSLLANFIYFISFSFLQQQHHLSHSSFRCVLFLAAPTFSRLVVYISYLVVIVHLGFNVALLWKCYRWLMENDKGELNVDGSSVSCFLL